MARDNNQDEDHSGYRGEMTLMDRHAWDERYRGQELLWKADPNRFLVAEVEGMAPGRALDLACGEGRNTIWLATKGWKVTAVDFSPVGLAKGRRMAEGRSLDVDWEEADLLEWTPPSGMFDLVIAFYLQLPAEQRRLVSRRASTALAPGGTVLIVGHDLSNLSEGYGGPTNPAVLFTPEDVAADLEGLNIERAERVRRPVAIDAGSGDVQAIDALVRASKDG
jgi:SAM-dependent methyltransferase